MLLIGGLGYYSLDGERQRGSGYSAVLAALARRRFVTPRVEKPGEGDSEGPPCTDQKATATLEARAFAAGLRCSRLTPSSTRVFIFAHSLWPLIASLMLPEEPASGMVAAETIGANLEMTVLNVSPNRASVRPYPADLTSEKCPVKFLSVAYIEGGDVRDFAGVDRQINARALAGKWPENPLWREVQTPDQQFELAPNSFLTLTYFVRDFRKECGAYSFSLPVGSVNVATTFTEPK